MFGINSLAQEMKLNVFTLSFHEKNEFLFLKKYYSDSLIQFRLSFVVVTFLYGIFGFLDPLMVKENAPVFQAIRFFVVVPLLLFVLIFSYSKHFEKIWQHLLFVSFIVAGSGISLMTVLEPKNNAYYAGMMLIFSAGYFFIKLRFFTASLAGWGTLALYNVGALFFAKDAESAIIINNNFFYGSANIIGMFAAYNIEYYARRDFFLNQQLDEKIEEVKHFSKTLENTVDVRTKQLVLAKNKAEQSDNLKSAFLGSMSHEIRTPLNSISGCAQLLPEYSEDKDIREFGSIIQSNVSQLLALFDDIIDISKIEAGVVELDESEFPLNELMSEVLRSFLITEDVKTKNLQIIVKNELSDSDSLIISDNKRLRQILFNLVGNACKYTNQGSIEFGYRLHISELYFYVKDTGPGIELEKQKDIFDRFMQNTLDRTPDKEGVGIGLYFSKCILKLFKGQLWVESEIGKGSIFYFNVPFKKGSDSTLTFAKNNTKIMEYNWKNKVILVVEDVANNFLLVKKSLKKTEVELIWAKNGLEAVDEFKQNPNIDLVLMDIRMPIMNGLEATKQIKEINPKMPIIAQTAYAMDGDRERSLHAGCDDYISKPINLKEFIELIAKFIEK